MSKSQDRARGNQSPASSEKPKKNRKTSRSGPRQKGMRYSGLLLIAAGIMLLVFLGSTTDFLAPSAGPSSSTDNINKQPETESSESMAGPRLVLEEAYFDFGTINQEEEVRHRISFTNRGSEDLIIRQIDTS